MAVKQSASRLQKWRIGSYYGSKWWAWTRETSCWGKNPWAPSKGPLRALSWQKRGEKWIFSVFKREFWSIWSYHGSKWWAWTRGTSFWGEKSLGLPSKDPLRAFFGQKKAKRWSTSILHRKYWSTWSYCGSKWWAWTRGTFFWGKKPLRPPPKSSKGPF